MARPNERRVAPHIIQPPIRPNTVAAASTNAYATNRGPKDCQSPSWDLRFAMRLKSEAKNKKGEVTWTALAEHVIDKVTEEVPKLIGDGAKQTPQEIKNIEGRSPLLIVPKMVDAAEAERLYQKGQASFHGTDVKQDYAEAVKWYLEAAKSGHAEAAYMLGWMCANGKGVKQDDAEALPAIASVSLRSAG